MDALHHAHHYSAQHYQGEALSVWHRMPVARRALVFILLFIGSVGEIRVVLTKRLSQLRNFPGHISLPGGKADHGLELPWMVARREMSEEIGLSENDAELHREYGVVIDQVTELPCYLSRTFSAVKPVVGFLNTGRGVDAALLRMRLRVNPGECSSIFLCPLHDFLYPVSDAPAKEALARTHHPVKWGGLPWNLRSYTFPQANPGEVHWLRGYDDLSATEDEDSAAELEASLAGPDPESCPTQDSQRPPKKPKKDLSGWGNLGSRRDSVSNEKIYDVWGLTANILHDLAEVVYLPPHRRSPGKQHGEEELIWSVWHHGQQMHLKERTPAEAALIRAGPADPASFGDVLPRTEFNRLKRIYSS
ncbi:hypothetical protein METBIDRAFT_36953 [Metschnikowia bicuspidata var. bicuspidata NRRL YB-4993]|uniref:Nudix hydrolase domain-containing protein n=1 Tax=Metschnikowia bicuspidata var. bicuspidata NRRL YB-4993 TaxID=869754 RepID=A0A1A0HJ62_9ASCO|nr:hypothetical protein METBIDRAFT_36953 [Metschnikowia bicuspidata var. bicuspidata NRRL YB-4993]OBA24055.1 hypothetical protein METBIDRAFT_36953 [Metschnikowia bicuspidata var. bicuspidata NRRL YB-4993]